MLCPIIEYPRKVPVVAGPLEENVNCTILVDGRTDIHTDGSLNDLDLSGTMLHC